MSATNDRVTNPGLLTSASKKSAPMDVKHMRKTEDGKVSVLDVVAQMKNCTQHYASKMYRRLVEEERVPDCEIRSLMSAKCGRQHRSHYPTPVASTTEITQISWQLPGANEIRKNCANVCVRYLGGDMSLVDEISHNKRLQEQLREDDPSHPARIFGKAVEQGESETVKRKQEELTLKKPDQ